MKIDGQRQQKAKNLLNSILAQNGKTLTSFCREQKLDRNKIYQKFFRNKQVSIDDLNSFISLIDRKLCLSVTKDSIIIQRK